VSVDEIVMEMGGVVTRAALLAVTDRAEVDRALADGRLVVLARGRYALPVVDAGRAAAHRLSGVVGLASAALHHGWAVKDPEAAPHVILPRHRKVRAGQTAAVNAHFIDLLPDEVVDGVTTREVTLTHCLRLLPFDEALTVADSAARDDELAMLRRVAAGVRGPGARQVRRVAGLARPGAANAFESVLRAIALTVPGLDVEPQILIRTVDPWARPDLVDVALRLVLEADSFGWHGDRAALRRDARRYDLLVADGWVVLRFAWEDVMFDPDFVRSVLERVVARLAQRQSMAAGAA
jgi:very-short-patch-repair endonuclease